MFSLKDFPARTLDRKKKLNSSNIWRAGWGISVVTCRAVVRLVWTQRRWRIRVKIFLNESSLWGPSMGRRHKEDAKRIKLQPREWVRWSVHSMRSTIHSLDYSLWKPWSPASGPHVRFQELYQGRGKWKEEHAAALSLLLWRRTTALYIFNFEEGLWCFAHWRTKIWMCVCSTSCFLSITQPLYSFTELLYDYASGYHR